MSSKHWAIELKEDYHALKSSVKLKAWSDLIIHLFNKREQDEIVELLQDKTKQVTFQMAVLVKDKNHDQET